MFDKKVLLFQMESEKKKKVAALAKSLNITPVIVTSAKYTDSIGSIASLPGFSPCKGGNSGEKLSDDMMIFVGLKDKDLDDFLKGYREQEIETTAHKCIVTATNSNWTPYMLFEELDREHKKMNQ